VEGRGLADQDLCLGLDGLASIPGKKLGEGCDVGHLVIHHQNPSVLQMLRLHPMGSVHKASGQPSPPPDTGEGDGRSILITVSGGSGVS
jgi:hypothetical protein